ncbi:AAA family ATPase [Achromobacter xylosoxidans]
MIKSLEFVSGAGVLSGFSWREHALHEFGRFNLIYGWNASGKTTLSRVFRLLDTAEMSRLPTGSYATFRVGDHIIDTRRKSSDPHFLVRVFNRDFIDDNLSDHTSAPALLIVGSDNIRLSKRITSLVKRRSKVADIYRVAKSRVEDLSKARDRLATNLATACGTALGIRNLRSPDLKRAALSIEGKAKDCLLDPSALQAAIDSARDQAEYTQIPAPLVHLPIEVIAFEDLEALLKRTPRQQAIKRLSENLELSEWVRNGLKFHQHTTACAFCGNDASSALAAYEQHFSDEYQRQHAAIATAIGRLRLATKTNSLPHPKDIVAPLREEFLAAAQRYTTWQQDEINVVNRWIGQLEEKLVHMDNAIDPVRRHSSSSALPSIVEELNSLTSRHNQACKDAAARRSQAVDEVTRHFAARYTLDTEAVDQIESLRAADQCLTRVNQTGGRIRTLIDAAQAELQRTSVAANEINRLLRLILGSRVSVEQAPDQQLLFMREGAPASNLSDGEKTAVSLAYFLVSLKQDGVALEDSIVFVDDPICSLDTNHIYEVAYLLLSELTNCKQFFVSTHNSDFFNTLKQEWTERGKFKKGHRGYLMHRLNDKHSALRELPSHLVKFRSDYHHVFYCLSQMKSSDSDSIDAYIHCPNLIRRFLEMYLGFRIPRSSGIQGKLSLLFDDEEIQKAISRFADEGSHSVSSLRLLEFSDFPAMARSMIDRLFTALEQKDHEHYAALVEATQ